MIAACLAPILARSAAAQDTASRGIRLGLTYEPGTKPGVVVLPVRGDGGDSVRAILQRDLDYGDRIAVIAAEGSSAAEVARAAAGTLDYPLWKALGAAAIVQATLTPGSLHVALHDVTARQVARVKEFPLATPAYSPEWRSSIHGVSDEIEAWITGTRGIARSRVLYAREGRIYVIDSDGAGDRAMTEGGGAMSPAWHPNGRAFAYSAFGERGTQILLRDLGSRQGRVVPGTTRGLNITPEFSPDGATLLYAHGEETGTDLMATDGTGSGPGHRITVSRGTDNVSPSFSPDGRRLAFTAGRSGHPEIYTADIDGSNAELLTTFNYGDQSYRSNPAWSPDGRLIAFQSQLGGRFQIMTISLRDRSVKQLSSDGVNEDPSWAPDARHLVFTSSRSGAKQLVVLDIESGRTRQLTRSPGSRLAAWSRRLADAAP
ncbi:MAG: hypothetical protein M3068_13325 [Gemmatimonadota bacterium]|nr:hypothetical protein [Gemmatimonadota bacterium]MDQ6888251.1 hypothetical protein [Gemmatimonadota bacterium]